MIALAVATPPRLAELEAIVERGQHAFLDVGRALLEIREAELFREDGYASFGAYLTERWPALSRRSLYNALAAAGVDDYDGLSPSHLVELARLSPAERGHLAALTAARELSVRELRELIRERKAEAAPRRPDVLVDRGEIALPPAAAVRLEVRDCRALPFEDGTGHLDRRHGAPCDGPDCPHPALVLESPPYNAGVSYEDDPTADALPWREYWHGLIVPHFREVFRILPHGGRFACNLANVLRSDTGDRRRGDGDGRRFHRPGDYVLRDRKRQHAGAGGEAWAMMVDRLIWSTWSRVGFLPRERFTWVKVTRDAADDQDDGDPRNTITQSTAWGTYGSPANPVARAVSEPIFVASKGSHAREHPVFGNSESIPSDVFKALTRNAWFIPNNVDRLRHPCPWPRGVPDNLLTLYTWPGDLVVNPFVGSGASAESAIELGRRFYGSDRSEVYVHDAQHRAAAALAGHAKRARYEARP